MKLIINISETLYNNLKNGCGIYPYRLVYDAIINGTPLPKGHGDLIDRNSILCDDCSCEQCGHTDECFRLLAPTIIKAE